MKVYLVQHAEAMPEEEDADRSLSDLGHRHAEQVAKVAAELGVEVAEIRHSGKTRAQQTAEIMGRALSPPKGVKAVSGLAPLDYVGSVAEELEEAAESLMLVGHLPFMERLAGHLLASDAHQFVIGFTNAGIVCLERQDDGWQAVWILTPKIVEIVS